MACSLSPPSSVIRIHLLRCLIALLAVLSGHQIAAAEPFLIVLGVSQDGGVPQAGSTDHPGWHDPAQRRLVASLGLVDPETERSWIFDATPDFPQQLQGLRAVTGESVDGAPDGVFLTHAHIGHYTGLMYLGHEVMGAQAVPVYAMARMSEYLSSNGPWDQLVRYENIDLQVMTAGEPVRLSTTLSVTPILVPHRQEYAEVVGFRVDGPSRSALFIPDIDSWSAWDEMGVRIEEQIAQVDVAYLDGTFYANGELPGRDMSGFPHPFISHSVERFSALPAHERAKIRFIHFNHSNPVIWEGSPARQQVLDAGFGLAAEGERQGL
jgi:pyrroloquinoline quinone biosynthesis protein B